MWLKLWVLAIYIFLSSASHHWSEYCRTCLCQNVYYHSGGLRLNPNLYNCGKVCLSLLNTWSGNKNEKWIPGVSTMLQVLVSIQGLILNTKPYFNEPGYAHMSGSESGEMRSQQYNEDTFVLSLRTMMYTMRRPPKVRFHFFYFLIFIGNKVLLRKKITSCSQWWTQSVLKSTSYRKGKESSISRKELQ